MNQLEESPHEHTKRKHTKVHAKHTRALNIYRNPGQRTRTRAGPRKTGHTKKETKQQTNGTKGRPKEPATEVGNRTRASQLHRRTPGPLDGSSHDSSHDSSHCSSAAGFFFIGFSSSFFTFQSTTITTGLVIS